VKTEAEIREMIKAVKRDYAHVLRGTIATIVENAPRALMQLEAEAKLDTLYWILGERYESKFK
jgi:hypothetical protein